MKMGGGGGQRVFVHDHTRTCFVYCGAVMAGRRAGSGVGKIQLYYKDYPLCPSRYIIYLCSRGMELMVPSCLQRERELILPVCHVERKTCYFLATWKLTHLTSLPCGKELPLYPRHVERNSLYIPAMWKETHAISLSRGKELKLYPCHVERNSCYMPARWKELTLYPRHVDRNSRFIPSTWKGTQITSLPNKK